MPDPDEHDGVHEDEADGAFCLGPEGLAPADALRLARRRALAGREELAAEVEAMLFRHDPIGIAYGDNTDEYRGEAESIVVRLPRVTSEAELLAMAHTEFVRWFDAATAGPSSRYGAVVAELWARVQRGSEPDAPGAGRLVP